MTQDKQEKYAEKIAKLLRHAESTSSQEEADAFISKAQALMTEYAIDEALLAKARGDNKKTAEKVIEHHIRYTGNYRQALYDIGAAITRANDCRLMIQNATWERPKATILYVIGFESDVERVQLLDASVQIQAADALNRWWKEFDVPAHWTAFDKAKARREFLFQFARALGDRLQRAKREGEREAARKEAARHGDGEKVAAAATESVALVLRSKRERVDEWVDERYGKNLRRVSRRYNRGSADAGRAGYAAGERADLGTPGMKSRKELR